MSFFGDKWGQNAEAHDPAWGGQKSLFPPMQG